MEFLEQLIRHPFAFIGIQFIMYLLLSIFLFGVYVFIALSHVSWLEKIITTIVLSIITSTGLCLLMYFIII